MSRASRDQRAQDLSDLVEYEAYGNIMFQKQNVGCHYWVAFISQCLFARLFSFLPSLRQSEAHFFEPYVEGDMAAFLRYLDVKRQNAVWGDDPEVQALCEIYDRPAEIWAYDPQV